MRGITLVELLVTVAILAVIMALLAFPLMAGFGYLQRATASREAQRVAQDATRTMQRELATAMYIEDLPPDGSLVTAFLEVDAGTGAPVNPANQQVHMVRYARIPDFPWAWDAGGSSWKLLQPNYVRDTNPANIDPTYEDYHSPFYAMQSSSTINPYVLARYESTTLPWSQAWDNRTATTLNGSYPMDGYAPTTLDRESQREELWRRLRNEYVAVTPYGQEWTVAGFRASPLRVSAESLIPQTDAHGARTTVYVSRYPLWAARSLDLDAVSNAQLAGVFGVPEDTWIKDASGGRWTLYPRGVNPYGYEVRVFDRTGRMVYGWSASAGTLAVERHYMEWPPIERPDLQAPEGWPDPEALDWRNEVMRHRLEGKLVFTQPFILAQTLTVAGREAEVPAPAGWHAALTYITDLPQTLPVMVGTTPLDFALASHGNPAALGPREYCLAQPGTRRLAFGADMPDGQATVRSDSLRVWMADIQSDDIVVASYATRSVLDISLTMARQNRAAMSSGVRQEYTATVRVEAKNAAKRARGSQ